MPLYERIALYSVADVAVVTATRDGMNLVPYNYITCRQGAVSALVFIFSQLMKYCCFICTVQVSHLGVRPRYDVQTDAILPRLGCSWLLVSHQSVCGPRVPLCRLPRRRRRPWWWCQSSWAARPQSAVPSGVFIELTSALQMFVRFIDAFQTGHRGVAGDIS